MTIQCTKDSVSCKMEENALALRTPTTDINQMKTLEKELKVSDRKMESRGASSSRISNKTIVQKQQQTQKQRQKQMRMRTPSWAQSTMTTKMCVYIAAFNKFLFYTIFIFLYLSILKRSTKHN